MKITVITHKAADGYWAEFPALPDRFAQGDAYDEPMRNIPEALDCHLGPDDVDAPAKLPNDVETKAVEVAL